MILILHSGLYQQFEVHGNVGLMTSAQKYRDVQVMYLLHITEF